MDRPRGAWGWTALVGIAYLAAGFVGLRLAFVNESTSPVWPATGIAISAFLLLGVRVAPAILVGAFAFNLATTGEPWSSAAIAVGNTLEGLVGAFLVRRYANGVHAFDRPPDTIRFAFACGLAAPLISATVGVTSLALLGLAPWSAFVAIWGTWLLGDAGGALLVVPAVVLWRTRPRDVSLGKDVARAAGFAAVAAAAAAVVFLVPAPSPVYAAAASLVLLPALAWPALRAGPREAATTLVAVAVIAVPATLVGRGPFARPSENDSLLLLQLFLAMTSTVVLALSATPREGSPRHAAGPSHPLLVLLTLLPVVAVTTATAPLLQSTSEALEEERFERYANSVGGGFERVLDEQAIRLAAAKGLIETANVSRAGFHDFFEASGWNATLGLQAAAFVRAVPAASLAEFENATRRDTSLDPAGIPGFAVHPPSNRTVRYVVHYIEPTAGNEAALGFDVGVDPERRAAVELAIDTGRPVASPPITLVQERGDQRAFLLVLAVYAGGDPGTAEGRRAALVGLVDTVHRAGDLFDVLLVDLREELGPVGLEVDVVTAGGAESVYRSDPGSRIADADRPRDLELDAHGQRWRLRVARPADLLTPAEVAAPFVLVAAGGALGVGLASAVWSARTTERRATSLAEEMTGRLRASESRFRSVLEAAPIAIAGVDAEGRIVYANPAVARVLGGSGAGSRLIDFAEPADRERLLAVLAGLSATPGTPSRAEVRLRRGEEAFAAGVEAVGTPTGEAILLIEDLTERKRAEEDRLRAASLAREVSQLQELDRLKTEFLNTAAHELATPLSPIRLFLYSMRERGRPDPREIEILVRNVDRLARLVNDLLDASRIGAGKLALERVEVDISELAEHALAAHAPVARASGLTLASSIEPGVRTSADPDRLLQVLDNLLSNATKYTPSGGTVTVGVARREGAVELSVRDTGVGIERERFVELFRPFTRVHDARASGAPGTGLGLYVSRGIVELHGGEIRAESEGPGRGSLFVVRLPLRGL